MCSLTYRGTPKVIMKDPPVHIKGKEAYEPLFNIEEKILEESLRREAERVSHQESVMNRVVYDSIEPTPFNPGVLLIIHVIDRYS